MTYLKSSKFKINCVMFMFMSLNVRVSKSFNCDFVIFNQIFSRFWNLFCNESNTWLNESSPSHVTWIVLFKISCGEQEHGDISGLIEQCNEATCTIDTTVYTRDAIFIFWIYLCSLSPLSHYRLILLFFSSSSSSVKLSTWIQSPHSGQLFTLNSQYEMPRESFFVPKQENCHFISRKEFRLSILFVL